MGKDGKWVPISNQLQLYQFLSTWSLQLQLQRDHKGKGDLDFKHTRLVPQKVRQVICLSFWALRCKFGRVNAHWLDHHVIKISTYFVVYTQMFILKLSDSSAMCYEQRFSDSYQGTDYTWNACKKYKFLLDLTKQNLRENTSQQSVF